jgi:hypothetical protein
MDQSKTGQEVVVAIDHGDKDVIGEWTRSLGVGLHMSSGEDDPDPETRCVQACLYLEKMARSLRHLLT